MSSKFPRVEKLSKLHRGCPEMLGSFCKRWKERTFHGLGRIIRKRGNVIFFFELECCYLEGFATFFIMGHPALSQGKDPYDVRAMLDDK